MQPASVSTTRSVLMSSIRLINSKLSTQYSFFYLMCFCFLLFFCWKMNKGMNICVTEPPPVITSRQLNKEQFVSLHLLIIDSNPPVFNWNYTFITPHLHASFRTKCFHCCHDTSPSTTSCNSWTSGHYRGRAVPAQRGEEHRNQAPCRRTVRVDERQYHQKAAGWPHMPAGVKAV